jgi:hypothetical protein
VAFEIDASRISLFNNCDCKACQKNSGAGFVSQLQVPVDAFRWLSGESRIARYESSPGVFRTFCDRCGSRLPMAVGDIVPVPAGLLDDELAISPDVNMHLSSRPGWAPVDETIHCLEGQGSEKFWVELVEEKQRDA